MEWAGIQIKEQHSVNNVSVCVQCLGLWLSNKGSWLRYSNLKRSLHQFTAAGHKSGATYCLSGYLLLVGQHCWLGLTVGFRQQHGRGEDLGRAQQFLPASRMCTWIWNDPGGGFRDACQRVVSSNLESSCWLQACKYTNTGTRRHSQSAYTCLSSCAVGRGVLALGSPNLAAQFG